MTDQYKCPSYYDDDNILRDCTCGKCGETTPQDWREEAVDEIVDEHPWIYRLEEALVNEDKYHYCEVDATDLKFTIKHYRRLQNLLTTHTTELIAHLEIMRKPLKWQTHEQLINIIIYNECISDIQEHLRSNNK